MRDYNHDDTGNYHATTSDNITLHTDRDTYIDSYLPADDGADGFGGSAGSVG
jgi:hypothetical protein